MNCQKIHGTTSFRDRIDYNTESFVMHTEQHAGEDSLMMLDLLSKRDLNILYMLMMQMTHGHIDLLIIEGVSTTVISLSYIIVSDYFIYSPVCHRFLRILPPCAPL